MADQYKSINSHYGNVDIREHMEKSFSAAGKDIESLTLDDLAMFDQLHFGGRSGTRRLAEMAAIPPGSNVVDIGSGVGGPARTLASEFGCTVTGIDLTEDYVAAARVLSEMVGLEKQVEFQVGSALDLPFENETFDWVWCQNSLMNIEDKNIFFKEAHRVLKPGGKLAVEVILAGSSAGLTFPVFWASTPEINFLVSPQAFQGLAKAAGFLEEKWNDITPEVIEAGLRQLSTPVEEQQRIGIEVVYKDVPLKGKNTMSGFQNGQLVNIYAVFQKEGHKE